MTEDHNHDWILTSTGDSKCSCGAVTNGETGIVSPETTEEVIGE